MATDVRHRGDPVNAALLKYEMGRKGQTTVSLSRLTRNGGKGVSRQVIGRALHGHPIDRESLRQIAEALAKAKVIDGGLLAKPTQLEDK